MPAGAAPNQQSLIESASAIILAAGKGTRMRSRVPKPLHKVAGRALIEYPLELCRRLSLRPVTVVAEPGLSAYLKGLFPNVKTVEQKPNGYGTGYATSLAKRIQQGKSSATVVLYADTPLLKGETVVRMVETLRTSQAAVVLLSALVADPASYGRIVRGKNGAVKSIVEAAAATRQQRKIREVNTGIVLFDSKWLWANVSRLEPDRAKGEILLTDMVGLAVAQNRPVECVTLADPAEGMGCDDRLALAAAEAVLRRRKLESLMLSGVTIRDPGSTYIDDTVEVGADSQILPGSLLAGRTVVGEECVIGPWAQISDSTLGSRCSVMQSVVEESTLEDDVSVGPFAHLRPGSLLKRGVHVGNFAEIKNSSVGSGTRIGHFGYLGDAEVGNDVNIGAGAVTCNFDGISKHPTKVRDGAFVGSGAMLVAPVTIGEKATIGAGSVVTRDVSDGALVYGVPARQHRPSAKRRRRG